MCVCRSFDIQLRMQNQKMKNWLVVSLFVYECDRKKTNNALVFLDFDFMHGSKIEHLKNGLRAKFEFDFAIFY